MAVPALLQAQNSAFINHVSVRNGDSAVDVEIRTTGKISSPNTQVITGPDRIVVDFPGARPASELRAVNVTRGPLKSVRTGLFFNNPPITRVVLDLSSAQTYHIVQTANGFIVRLGAAAPAPEDAEAAPLGPTPTIGGARLTNVARVSKTAAYSAPPVRPVVGPAPQPEAQTAPPPPPEPPKPAVSVSFQGGMLSIQADKATLAQVLFEVQRQTQAEIGIPAGAEQEQVVANLGPAPVRDVLESLLNGSSYNFIFVGNENDNNVGKVILTRREASF